LKERVEERSLECWKAVICLIKLIIMNRI
jgi:hypothetical protein